MITITEAAEKKIAELVAQNEKPIKGLRIGARSESSLKVDYKPVSYTHLTLPTTG